MPNLEDSQQDDFPTSPEALLDEMRQSIEDRIRSENASQSDSQESEEYPLLPIKELESYLDYNRVGDAMLYNRLHRGKVIFVKHWERFLVWTGNHWSEDDENLAPRLIENLCKQYLFVYEVNKTLLSTIDPEDKILQKSCERKMAESQNRVKYLRDVPARERVLTLVSQVEDPLLILPDKLDTLQFEKAAPNGVIDLRSGVMHRGKPEEYLLKAIATPYYPERYIGNPEPCPNTTSFLMASLDQDSEKVEFIYRLLGSALVLHRPDRIFVIFWGEHGSNGKDTLIKHVTETLGRDLSGDVPVEMILQSPIPKNSSAPDAQALKLRGMTVAWINEAEDGQRFALAKLKKLTGGGYITARGIQDKQPTTWLQTHLPIMTTNELPKAKADDAAFWTRCLIVKFPLSFVDNPIEPYQRPAIKNIDEILSTEREGFLVRIIRGAMDYCKNGLQVPQSVLQATNDQRMNWDDVGQFLSDCCFVEEPHQDDPRDYKTRTLLKDLYDAFCIWFSENKDNRYKVPKRKFSALMIKKGIISTKDGDIYFGGVSLNDEIWEKVVAKREYDKKRAKKQIGEED